MAKINILSRVLSNFKALSPADRRALFIEIGEACLKVVETKDFKGSPEIARLMKHDITSKDHSMTSGEIAGIIGPFDAAARKCRINLPQHYVVTRLLKIPSTDEEEIAKIIKLEALKHIPFTGEAIISGYRTIERFPDGYSNVFLAITQSNTINNIMALLETSGIKDADIITVGAESLLLWHLVTRPPKEAGANVFIINIDIDHIDIDAVEGEKLTFARGVAHDSLHTLTARNIVDEIKVSIASYRKKSDRAIDKVILTGIQDKAAECSDMLAKELNINVEAADQMRNIPIADGAAISSDGGSFAELIGLALRGRDVKINLMPEELKEARRLQSFKKALLVTVSLASLSIMMAFGLMAEKLHAKSVFLGRITNELKKISPQVTKARKMMKDIDVVAEELSARPLAIDIISELYRVTPDGMILNMIDYESRASLTVRGSAANLSDVFKYVTLIEASPYFENVKVKYANKRMVAEKEVADFEIASLISKVK